MNMNSKSEIPILIKIIKRLPFTRSIYRYRQWQRSQSMLREDYPRGHYYSPLPDIQWTRENFNSICSSDADALAEIDLQVESQKELFHSLETYFESYDFPEQKTDGYRYYSNNSMFGKGSAYILYSMIRHFQPKRIIEAGSGFTSALMLDTNERFMNRQIRYTFIEPFPERLYSTLKDDDKQTAEIITKPLQEVPMQYFEQLQANDFLFIDSSHVSKVGSDVNHIIFDILPILRSGVIVHFHDIYWPFEYPLDWIELGRAWNEAYALRAFLQYNNAFKILLFNNYVTHKHSELYKTSQSDLSGLGSSIWLRKK